ncbi:MAG: hypothetical protein VB092_09380 [Oscillospiraceae bacterium]|nr:hypothetical protein [Oscillospiraceae bacterium]
MKTLTKKRTERSALRRAAVFTAVGYVIWAAAARFFLLAPWLDLLRFFGFQLFAVALPGFALYKLLGLRLTPLETLTVSYALGLAALCALYFVFASFHAMAYIEYAVIAEAAAAALVLYIRRSDVFTDAARPDTGELRIALILCAFAALSTFIIFSASYLNPSLAGARNYFHDVMNGVALTVSASRGFPMEILQMSGTEHRYHILYFAYGAIMKLCTGINAFEIVTKCTLITLSPLIAAGVVFFAKRLLPDNRLCAAASVAAIVLPGSFTPYLYSDAIGFPMGLAFGLLSVVLFLEARVGSEKKVGRYYALSSAFLLCSMGAKGPIAVSLLFGVCFVLLLDLLRKKDASVFLKGLLYVVPFFIAYALIYSGGAGDSMSVKPLYYALSTPFADGLRGKLPDLFYKLICCVQYAVGVDGLLSATVGVLLLWVLLRKKHSDAVALILSGSVCGWVLLNIFCQMGGSETYFATVFLPFAPAVILYCLRDLYVGFGRSRIRAAFAGLCAAGCLLFVFTATSSTLAVYYGNGHEYYKTGIVGDIAFSRFSKSLVFTAEQLAARRAQKDPAYIISVGEYEAMLWLRDNTPQDAVIADTRYIYNNKYFNGSAFSERAFYLEGWGYVTMEDSNKNTQEKVKPSCCSCSTFSRRACAPCYTTRAATTSSYRNI